MQRTNRLCGKPFRWAPDESLLHRAQRGDADAFGTLATRHWATVYRVARNMLPAEEEAAQVAEATFLAVRGSSEAFPPGVPFTTSLYRVALGEAWRRLRTEPAPVAEGRTVASRVREVLQGLDSLDRAAFVLREIEQIPLAEAADVLGITPASIRERTHRATLMFTGILAGAYEPAEQRW
jgi:RNA polymerase sigma-70 factor (ECF subfamily)